MRKGGTYLFVGDEGAGERHDRPEEDAAAKDDLPVETVAQVTEDRGSEHEAADEHCENIKERLDVRQRLVFGPLPADL